MVTGSGTAPENLPDKKDGKVNKGIFDIHVIDVYFTSVHSNPWVFDVSSVAKVSTSKHELQIPRLIRSPSHTPSTFGISVEPK